jgi:hypothetical protein
MDAKLQAKCDLLAENYQTVQSSAKLDAPEAACLGALIYTSANAQANEAEIRANRALLREKVSVVNNLRGYVNVALLSKMSLSENAEAYLDNVITVYNLLKQGHLYRDEYEALAATAIVDFAQPSQYAAVAQHTQDIIKKMKETHPIITDTQDTTVAALLAMSDLDIEATLDKADACYQALKDDHFKWAKNDLQCICMILALNNMSVQEGCERFRTMRQTLKESGSKMYTNYLPILAALVDTNASPAQIAQDIKEAEGYLKGKKGFGGIFGVGKQMRMVLSAAVLLQTINEAMGKTGIAQASSNALATVITEQVIMAIVLFLVMSSFIVHNSATSTTV